MPKLLIDGDALVYRAAFAAQRTKYLVHAEGTDEELVRLCDDAKEAKAVEWPGATIWSRIDLQPEDQAILIFNTMLKDIKDHYAKENLEVRIYLSPSVGNFREQLATRQKYKGNRSLLARPVHLGACRDRAIGQGAVVVVGAEADDGISIAATENPGSVVCSIDKDLKTIPGRFYNFVTKTEELITPREASIRFLTQCLTGDQSDNILGIEGIGPVRAAKILEGTKNYRDGWAKVLKAYQEKYGNEQGTKWAIEAGQLLWLQRKQGEIWQPPTQQ